MKTLEKLNRLAIFVTLLCILAISYQFLLVFWLQLVVGVGGYILDSNDVVNTIFGPLVLWKASFCFLGYIVAYHAFCAFAVVSSKEFATLFHLDNKVDNVEIQTLIVLTPVAYVFNPLSFWTYAVSVVLIYLLLSGLSM
jgi:hypothetical protein